MKKMLFVIAIVMVATWGWGAWYISGDFNGFSANEYEMVDDGTGGDAVSGDLIYTFQTNVATAGDHRFKVHDGSWGSPHPGSDNGDVICFTTTADNETVTFTLDTRASIGDGWYPDTMRVECGGKESAKTWDDTAATYNSITTLYLVGDIQSELGDSGDWANPSALEFKDDGSSGGDTSAGDGIFTMTRTASADVTGGSWKAIVVNGSWNVQIGANQEVKGENGDGDPATISQDLTSGTVYKFEFNVKKRLYRVTSGATDTPDWELYVK